MQIKARCGAQVQRCDNCHRAVPGRFEWTGDSCPKCPGATSHRCERDCASCLALLGWAGCGQPVKIEGLRCRFHGARTPLFEKHRERIEERARAELELERLRRRAEARDRALRPFSSDLREIETLVAVGDVVAAARLLRFVAGVHEEIGRELRVRARELRSSGGVLSPPG